MNTLIKKRIFSLLLFIIVFKIGVLSQNFPVRVVTTIVPPYSLYLSDYFGAENKLTIQIIPLDRTLNNFKVKLRMKIEGNGIKMETSETFNQNPIFISAGEVIMLTGEEISYLLNVNNLNISGITRESILSGAKLPEGLYNFSFTINDFNRNTVLSNNGSALAFMVLNDPPLLNLPLNNSKITQTNVQNILFQWTPRNTGSPNSSFETNYIFRLFELDVENMDPNQVVMSKIPNFETTVDNTLFFYGIDAFPLTPGKKYAYYIQAKDKNNKDYFRNDGKSEVRVFTYGDECKFPDNINISEIKGPGVAVQWQQAINQTSYEIEFGKSTNNFFEQTNSTRFRFLDNIIPGQEYQVRIKSHCFDYSSNWSPIYSITMKETATATSFSCSGINNLILPVNKVFINKIVVGDEISIGGFKAKITQISVSGNQFSGEALVEVPYLSNAKIKHSFKNIKINELYEVIEGVMHSIASSNSVSFTNPVSNVINDFNDTYNEINTNIVEP